MNSSRRRGVRRRYAWTVLACLFAASARVCGIDAVDVAKKTPAEWVAQLGSQSFPEREEASAALNALGAKARGDIRAALDSKDPEVLSRARVLWEKIRWEVVPGAEKETAQLVAGVKKEKSEADAGVDTNADSRANYNAWHFFVKKHGAQSLPLVAEFRSAGFPPDYYENGLVFVLQSVSTSDLTDFISQSGGPGGQASLESLLDEMSPEKTEAPVAAEWVKLRSALGENEKAFEFGRAVAFRTDQDGSDDLNYACAVAVRRGMMFDNVAAAALKDVAAETDPDKLCAKLSFYAGIMGWLHRRGRIDALCDAAHGADPLAADETWLGRLVKPLVDGGRQDRVAKMLHDTRTPLTLYMRSYAALRAKNMPASDADLRLAEAAADAITDAAKKKSAYYDIADLMQDWNDPRAAQLWEKIMAMPAADSADDANVCFRFGELMIEKKQYAKAAGLLQKGVDLSAQSGILTYTDDDGWVAPDGASAMLEEIKDLKDRAAAQKSVPASPAPAEEDKPAPPKTDTALSPPVPLNK